MHYALALHYDYYLCHITYNYISILPFDFSFRLSPSSHFRQSFSWHSSLYMIFDNGTTLQLTVIFFLNSFIWVYFFLVFFLRDNEAKYDLTMMITVFSVQWNHQPSRRFDFEKAFLSGLTVHISFKKLCLYVSFFYRWEWRFYWFDSILIDVVVVFFFFFWCSTSIYITIWNGIVWAINDGVVKNVQRHRR